MKHDNAPRGLIAFVLAPFVAHLFGWSVVWAIMSIGSQMRSLVPIPFESYLLDATHVGWTLIQSCFLLAAALVIKKDSLIAIAITSFVVSTAILVVAIELSGSADRQSGYIYLFSGATIVTGASAVVIQRALSFHSRR